MILIALYPQGFFGLRKLANVYLTLSKQLNLEYETASPTLATQSLRPDSCSRRHFS